MSRLSRWISRARLTEGMFNKDVWLKFRAFRLFSPRKLFSLMLWILLPLKLSSTRFSKYAKLLSLITLIMLKLRSNDTKLCSKLKASTSTFSKLLCSKIRFSNEPSPEKVFTSKAWSLLKLRSKSLRFDRFSKTNPSNTSNSFLDKSRCSSFLSPKNVLLLMNLRLFLLTLSVTSLLWASNVFFPGYFLTNCLTSQQ